MPSIRCACLAVLVLVAGCTTRPDAPETVDLALLAARHGQTAAATASLTVVAEHAGERQIPLTLALKLAADDRLWLAVERHDHRICVGVVAADGAARLYSPRLPGATRVAAGQADAPAFVRAARLLAADLLDGPVPAGAGAAPLIDLMARTRVAGIDYELGIVAGRVVTKRISDDTGELAQLAYRNERVFEGLRRGAQADLRLAGDPAVYAINLNRLTPVPAVAETALVIAVPEGTPELSLADFTSGLEQLQ